MLVTAQGSEATSGGLNTTEEEAEEEEEEFQRSGSVVEECRESLARRAWPLGARSHSSGTWTAAGYREDAAERSTHSHGVTRAALVSLFIPVCLGLKKNTLWFLLVVS